MDEDLFSPTEEEIGAYALQPKFYLGTVNSYYQGSGYVFLDGMPSTNTGAVSFKGYSGLSFAKNQRVVIMATGGTRIAIARIT